MGSKLRGAQPIVTLTSDFGLADSYVAEMKASVLSNCAHAQLIDVTHLVPRHDVAHGTLVLERAISAFAAKTVHLAVVDPGVGSSRRILISRIRGQTVVCPDNGLITWAFRIYDGQVLELIWRPKKISTTFHGRDVMGPIAGMIAAGKSLRGMVRAIDDPVLLDMRPARGLHGKIIYVDGFGNCVTNLGAKNAKPQAAVKVHGQTARVKKTYADVPRGDALAVVGSAGLLEIAVREGSAAAKLKLRLGDKVEIITARR